MIGNLIFTALLGCIILGYIRAHASATAIQQGKFLATLGISDITFRMDVVSNKIRLNGENAIATAIRQCMSLATLAIGTIIFNISGGIKLKTKD